MELGIKGKKAIVCGGSRGMGYAIAQSLSEEGVAVSLIARDPAELEKARKSIARSSQGEVHVFPQDLAKVSAIPALFRQIEKKMKGVDILINNAGGPPPGGLFDVTEDDWHATFDRNLRSVIAATSAVIPGMKKNSFGRILNIASQVVKEPAPRMILSNTLRSGVAAFAKTISFELAPFNITINTLCPGAIMTDRLESLMSLRAKSEKRSLDSVMHDVENSIPMKRIGKPEEFADMAVFLCSDRASYVTGTLIAVDGGVTKGFL